MCSFALRGLLRLGPGEVAGSTTGTLTAPSSNTSKGRVPFADLHTEAWQQWGVSGAKQELALPSEGWSKLAAFAQSSGTSTRPVRLSRLLRGGRLVEGEPRPPSARLSTQCPSPSSPSSSTRAIVGVRTLARSVRMTLPSDAFSSTCDVGDPPELLREASGDVHLLSSCCNWPAPWFCDDENLCFSHTFGE